VIGILVEVQKSSTDTDILKAIAYYEEYLAEEAHNPAPDPRQPAVTSTPAPAVKPTPIVAKTATSHRQQPQPKAPQPQRKKKRR